MTVTTRPLRRRAALALAAMALPGLRHAIAQPAPTWPERPVRLINTGAPGSGIDLISRLVAEGLASKLGQPFLVENRPAANMMLAAEAHATARPGDTLLLGATALASTVPYTQQGRVPYDPEADLAPVAIVGREFLCLTVQGTLPVRNAAELFALAKARPGTLNWYSVPGFMELAFRKFLHEQGLDMTYVAYRGSPPAVLDLAAGRIQAAILPLTPALGAIQQGTIRALATTSQMRAPVLPAVPGMLEAGVPALQYEPFTGLFGWKGMDAATRGRLSAAVAEVMREPRVATALAQAGILPHYAGASDLAEVIASQRGQVQAAVRLVGLRPPG